MRLKVIACDVLARELYECASISRTIIDIELLDSTYHEKPESLHSLLQKKIDEQEGYDYLLIGFGLCGKVLNNLKSRDIPLVIPKAHDCITLFMGNREKYERYFIDNPGTMFYPECWSERKGLLNERKELESIGLDKSFAEYEEKYGKEMAQYIYETLGDWKSKYSKALYLYNKNMGKPYSEDIKKICKERNWEYREEIIDNSLLRKLLNMEWNEKEFLVVEKNRTVSQSIGQQLIEYK